MDSEIKKELILDGLCCGVCANKIEDRVRKLENVQSASIDFANQRLTLTMDADAEVDNTIHKVNSIIQQVEPGITTREKELVTSNVKTIYLLGLTCADCAGKIEKKVSEIEGVKRATVDVMSQKLTIEAMEAKKLPIIIRKASQIAVQIEPTVTVSLTEKSLKENSRTDSNKFMFPLRFGIGGALFFVGLILDFTPSAELIIFLLSYLCIGGEVVGQAVKNIAKGQVFDENFLMSVATIGSFAIGEYPEGVAVMLFYQIGEAFQRLAVNRSRKSISALMDIRPDFANLKTSEGLQKVSPEEVGVGAFIVVKPGEKVPLDGVVVEGYSTLDTSALTGESLPRDITVGDEILSGAINKNGLLTVEVKKEFGESTVSKILNLVQNASGNKAPMENFITKFARYYTPAVVLTAVLLALIPPVLIPGAQFTDWLNRALVFLVISCPCALVISIPLSYFGGIGGASRSGILVKGSNFLEALNKVDTIVFDKTGTLTKGTFKVREIQGKNGFTSDELLRLAAIAESNSTHPIAESIGKAYPKTIDSSSLKDYEEMAGFGLSVNIDGKDVLAGNSKLMKEKNIVFTEPDSVGTVVHIAVDKIYAGYIIIADEVKADSKEALRKLKAIGVKRTVMLTGDTKTVGEKIANDIGLDTVYTELLPQEKVEQLEKLEKSKMGKGALVYVGDGINDAPVLARSDIGIAMGGVGSDAAIEAADIVIMTDEPSKIVTAIKIAKKTRTIVWQNIIFALGVKAIILILGAFGVATMWEAVFGDVGVALIAILNAMRAMKINEES